MCPFIEYNLIIIGLDSNIEIASFYSLAKENYDMLKNAMKGYRILRAFLFVQLTYKFYSYMEYNSIIIVNFFDSFYWTIWVTWSCHWYRNGTKIWE